MNLSLQLRQALKSRSCQEALQFLKAKLELDHSVSHLTSILHWSLYQELKNLRSHMCRLPGSVQHAVNDGWASVFPCMAVGLNRTTRIHRDSQGFRNGLDIISVLGQFSDGHLNLPDLGLKFEWEPGCLGAFDGYDLAHSVEPWDGSHRVTVISFCRSSSWRRLKLPLEVSAPSLEEAKKNLASAIEDKAKAGNANRINHKRHRTSNFQASRPRFHQRTGLAERD
jgi:hypothetical protein